MKKILKDKHFLSTIIALVIPITLQNLISSSLNMVDNLMIGKLGESAIAAVGLVNQYFFVYTLAVLGINAGASIFIAQFWGKKDIHNIRKMIGLDMTLSVFVSILFSMIVWISPEAIVKIFTKNPEVIALGAEYIKFVSITFIFSAITQVYSTSLRSIGIANPPMYGSLIGVLTNAFLNWILIFGHFGFPAMGVKGAAIATSIARFVEMAFVIISAYVTNEVIPAKLNEIFGFNFEFIKIYFRTSYSVILNELIWSLGLSAYSIIYAKIGIREVASMQIATTINNMFMVLSIGVATAASIMIGNKIGEDQEEVAIDYAVKLGILTPMIGLVSGVALWVASPFIVSIFNINKDTAEMTIVVLRIMAVFAPLRFFNVLMIVGVFRGGGDTTYSMLVQLGTVWFFAIPAGYIGAAVFNLSLGEVFFIICLEEVVKIGFEFKRLHSKKWIKNIINDVEALSASI